MDQETAFGAFMAAAAMKATVSEIIKDIYKAGKDVLRKLSGKGEEAAVALEEVEREPASAELQDKARQALAASGALQNQDFLAIVERLLQASSSQGAGPKINVAIGQGAHAGNVGKQIIGNVTGDVNFGS